jgi:purine-cytosine permease-like protein
MSGTSMQRPTSVPRWPAHVMLCGLVCILLGIAGLLVAQQYPSMVQASNVIGYLGLFLVLIGFFSHISLDWP